MFDRRRLVDALRARLATGNAVFTAVAFLAPPLGGSVWTILFHIAGVWAVIAAALRLYPFRLSRDARILTGPLYAIVAAYVIGAIVHPVSFVQFVGSILWVATLALFPFIWSAWSISDRAQMAHFAAHGGAAGALLSLGVALIEVVLYGLRPEAAAGNAIVFAMAVALCGLVALAGAFDGARREVMLAGYVASFGAVGLSGSRAAILSLIVGTLLVLALNRRVVRRWRRRTVVAGTAVLLVVVLPLTAPTALRLAEIPSNIAAINDHANYQSELGQRLAIWSIGLSLVAERPLTGFGPVQSREILRERLASEFNVTQTYSHFHNGFLTLAVQAGVFAALAALAIFAYAGAMIWRAASSADATTLFGASVLAGWMAVFLICGLLGAMIGHDILDVMFATGLVVGSILIDSPKESPLSG